MAKRKLPELNGEIKSILAAKEKTIEQLASEAGGLSSSSLRSWISRNRFPHVEWPKLAIILGLPEDQKELEELFSFDWAREKMTADRVFEKVASLGEATLNDRLQNIEDNFVAKFARLYTDFGEDVQGLFELMQKNDQFYYLSLDEPPYEMTEEGRLKTVGVLADALTKGACFTYFFPSSELLDEMYNSLPSLPSSKVFTKGFERTQKHIKTELSKRGASDVNIENLLRDHFEYRLIHAVPGTRIPFLAPGHKYVCFLHDHRMRAFARFPTGTQDKELHLHVPLGGECTQNFVNIVNELLEGPK